VRVFLDTNVLVSAFAGRGLCSDLYESVLLRHELVTGANVLRELTSALREKLRMSAEQCHERVHAVSEQAVETVGAPTPLSCKADADDLLVLGEAVAGGSQFFVTGDADLVRLKSVGNLRILTPREFWELLRSEKSE